MWRRGGLLIVLLVIALAGFLLVSGSDGSDPRGPVAEANCSNAVEGSPRLNGKSDVVFDLFALMGARRTAGRPRDAFDGHGYKVPATLPWGVTATLSVPAGLRSRVGLVYSLDTQERVFRKGVEGADSVVRFTACPTGGERQRTGWPGGLVVDRRRCVVLVARIAGRGSMRRRVPLGRRC